MADLGIDDRSHRTDPGKRLLGLRVIDGATLRPVGFGRMFWVRWLVAGIVAYFAILFTLGILLL